MRSQGLVGVCKANCPGANRGHTAHLSDLGFRYSLARVKCGVRALACVCSKVGFWVELGAFWVLGIVGRL